MNNNIVKLTVFLLIVTAVSGMAIGAVNGITAPEIAKQKEAALQNGYKEVYAAADEYIARDYSGKEGAISDLIIANQGGKEKGVIYLVQTKGYGGTLEFLVGFDLTSETITGIKILTQNETAGLGANCKTPWFAQRFVDKSADKALQVVKVESSAGHEIQAITAATITSTAVVDGVNAARADFEANYAGRTGQ